MADRQTTVWPHNVPLFNTNIVVRGAKVNIFKYNLGMDAGHDYLIGRFTDVTSVTWNKHILTSKEVNKSHRYFVNRSINT